MERDARASAQGGVPFLFRELAGPGSFFWRLDWIGLDWIVGRRKQDTSLATSLSTEGERDKTKGGLGRRRQRKKVEIGGKEREKLGCRPGKVVSGGARAAWRGVGCR